MEMAQLTLRAFLWRAKKLFPEKEIVTYSTNSTVRYNYTAYADRVAQLSNALEAANIAPGDTVGTFCWNHYRHFETYFGVPNAGAKLHTINVRHPEDHIRYILRDAGDKLLFVDPELIKHFEALIGTDAFESVEQFVVMDDRVPSTDLSPIQDYESFIDGHSNVYEGPPLDENQPATMAYTSGTTGKPKGVEYTHRMLWTQIMTTMMPGAHGFDESSVILQTVPMFHINGWGWPYEATAQGAKIVFPGPSPDAETLCTLISREEVTFTGGVPTVWVDVLKYLDRNDVDMSSLQRIFSGGSTPPQSVIRRFKDEYDVDYRCASGMTEVTALATTSVLKSKMGDWDDERKIAQQQKAGLVLPGLQFKVIDENGSEVQWDGESIGELYYKGPWVVTKYYNRPEETASNFENGWLKTGDLVTVDKEGYIDIVDRKDDMIKSGGEWISSVELENTIMDHKEVYQATVIGVSNERWGERPIAVIALSEVDADRESVVKQLEEDIRSAYPKWWSPNEFVFVDKIPKTSTGKFDKETLRKSWENQTEPFSSRNIE